MNSSKMQIIRGYLSEREHFHPKDYSDVSRRFCKALLSPGKDEAKTYIIEMVQDKKDLETYELAFLRGAIDAVISASVLDKKKSIKYFFKEFLRGAHHLYDSDIDLDKGFYNLFEDKTSPSNYLKPPFEQRYMNNILRNDKYKPKLIDVFTTMMLEKKDWTNNDMPEDISATYRDLVGKDMESDIRTWSEVSIKSIEDYAEAHMKKGHDPEMISSLACFYKKLFYTHDRPFIVESETLSRLFKEAGFVSEKGYFIIRKCK